MPLHHPRKDRYNKKLFKYYVVYEEGDESLSEDEEQERHEETEAQPVPKSPCP